MGEGNAAIKSGEGLSAVEIGDSLMTHSVGSVTTQSIAFKYVMASEQNRYSYIIKTAIGRLPYIKIYLLL
jgi:hypothetical protein